jgi:hypothetical protein
MDFFCLLLDKLRFQEEMKWNRESWALLYIDDDDNRRFLELLARDRVAIARLTSQAADRTPARPATSLG